MPLPPPDPPPGVTVYAERRFQLRVCDLALRGGGHERRGVVVHGGSVVLLPRLGDQIVFIRNHRWQVGRRLLELPAGTLSPGEAPLACAARELIEETGYAADRLTPWHTLQALPGLTTEQMHVFLAEGLTHVGQRLEADEDIEVCPLPIAEVHRRLIAGEIDDMKTLAILGLWFARQPVAPGP